MAKVFICKECDKSFTKYNELRRHNKLHTGQHSFMCDTCGLGFIDNNRLLIHVSRSHTGLKPFECCGCEKSFERSSDLNRHMKVHEKDGLDVDCQFLDDILECTISEKDGSLNYSLDDSFDDSSNCEESTDDLPKNLLDCMEGFQDTQEGCDFDHFMAKLDDLLFSENKNMQFPVGDVNGDKHHVTYGEDKARNSFASDVSMEPQTLVQSDSQISLGEPISELPPDLNAQSDSQTNHNKIPKLKTPKLKLCSGDKLYVGKPFECEYCEKTFSKSFDFRRHVMIHTGVRPYVCHLCGAAFVENSKLKKHLKRHTGERPYACEQCSKTFVTYGDLTVHKKIHSGVKKFVCDVCNKRFLNKTDLTRHIRIHTGERPFACSVCGASFAEKGNLKKHTEIHAEGRQCNTKSDSKRPVKRRMKSQPCICTICSRRFRKTQSLKVHLKRIHKLKKLPTTPSTELDS